MSIINLFRPKPDVQTLKTNHDVYGLIRALQYKRDSDVRWAAATALGGLGGTIAIGPLVEALKDKFVRWEAATALEKIGQPAIEPLSKAVAAGDTYVRNVAQRALANINTN